MNTRKILALKRKAEKEAQKAVEKIYKKYNVQMNDLLAELVPKGHTLRCGNGMILQLNEKGEEITSGRAWGIRTTGDNEQLNVLSGLQYTNSHEAGFEIKNEIKGKKKVNELQASNL